jgi:hypothetical protein
LERGACPDPDREQNGAGAFLKILAIWRTSHVQAILRPSGGYGSVVESGMVLCVLLAADVVLRPLWDDH